MLLDVLFYLSDKVILTSWRTENPCLTNVLAQILFFTLVSTYGCTELINIIIFIYPIF